MSRTLLIVDDEAHVGRALATLLRKCAYRIFTVTNARDGLECLKNHEVGVIISDYRMPEMDGVRFLAEACRQFPDTYRIMLTGQADFDAVVASINTGAVHKFLLKPWNPRELPLLIEEAFTHYELRRDNRSLMKEIQLANARLKQLNTDLERQIQQKSLDLEHALFFDAVTHLPNRVVAMNRLTKILADSKDQKLAVGILDLDNFKLLNDNLGPQLGDEVLRITAERLSKSLHGNEFIARLGNDEFCLIMSEPTTTEIARRIEEILTLVQKPLLLHGHKITMTACLGFASFPQHGQHAELLLSRANISLQLAKREGINTFRCYHPSFNEQSLKRLSMITDLEQALSNHQFSLFLQPKLDLRSGCIVGAETLIRWHHPKRGWVLPGEFISLLEESGLIVAVGKWILEDACRITKRLQTQGINIPLAVNLSLRQFQQPDLAEFIQRTVNRHDLDEKLFPQLEITESTLMQEREMGLTSLKLLHDEWKFSLALDDFGTGYSSLAHVAQFPIDYLKIDKSFIQRIGQNEIDEAIVIMITELANDLHLQVIAEGVETLEQLEFLRHTHCHQAQGYLISRPVPETEFIHWIKEWNPSRWCFDSADEIVAS